MKPPRTLGDLLPPVEPPVLWGSASRLPYGGRADLARERVRAAELAQLRRMGEAMRAAATSFSKSLLTIERALTAAPADVAKLEAQALRLRKSSERPLH